MILNAGDLSGENRGRALEHLCESYWRPLYCYVRQRGQSEEDAKDLTQAFFARLLEKNTVEHANRERGKFRTFLLTSMKNFLSNEWRKASAEKRGGGKSAIPLESAAGETLFITSHVDDALRSTLRLSRSLGEHHPKNEDVQDRRIR